MAKAAKVEAPEVKREARLEMVSGEGCTWLNVEKPTHKELDYLAQYYPFHPMDLDDCISRIQLSKLDEYPDYLFVILHFPLFNKRARFTTASQVSVFVGRDFLVTVHSGDLKPLVNLFKECQEKEESRQEYLGKDPGFLLYRLVDALVDFSLPMMDKILANLERVEDEVFDTTVDAAQEVAVLRRDIAAQRRIFWPMKAVLAELEQKAQRFTKVDLKVYFGDINDHLSRIWGTLEEAKETVEIYKDTDFVLGQDRLQRIMAILTMIIAITLPFSVISSIYGMNIPLPGSGSSGHPWVGLVLILLMTAAAVGLIFFFRRRRWI
ncbi:MAG: magnesium transporter CorA family protein [Chloroflexi bacterium]|nr:magnesium transporter CorA family protein [Chloroflexota bacterium]